MRNKLRSFAVLVGAVALVAGPATAATAHDREGSFGHFGYQQVRSGIPRGAGRFTVRSPDLGDRFPAGDLANAFGCAGTNKQPSLTWSNVPAGTRSLAVTMFDVDAPTGSGFWHWVAWDLPATSHSLGTTLPAAAVSGTNDAGQLGYAGPCPVAGDIAHRYQITVYALDVPSLELPAGTPPAVTTFTMSSHILAYGRMTATAKR
jgi:Raf kinase inhibitor-like YbhB/YbcL family protein